MKLCKKIGSIALIFLIQQSDATSSLPICHSPYSITVMQRMQKAGAIFSQAPQTDYGRMLQSANCYWEAWPKHISQVVALIRQAYANNIPIRIQGASHSQNGNSLPRPFELTIHTNQLNQMVFNHKGYVLADAGIPIVLIQQAVERYSDYFVPIANGGGVGPTLGGFISAGGFSPASATYGGLWENISAITLVTGDGKILRIKKNNPLFLWLFGSMGQLGMIVQVELKLIHDSISVFPYPLHRRLTIEYPQNGGQYWSHAKGQPLYWFNLLVPEKNVKLALQELSLLQNKYPSAMTYYPIYQWPIKFIAARPPLLLAKKLNYVLLGNWGHADNAAQLVSLEKEFSLWVHQHHYQRYIQAELSHGPAVYQAYFGVATYRQFKNIKKRVDPKFLFNPGSVFNQ